MNCVKINRFFRIPRVVGRGNPDYKPVEIRTSVPRKGEKPDGSSLDR